MGAYILGEDDNDELLITHDVLDMTLEQAVAVAKKNTYTAFPRFQKIKEAKKHLSLAGQVKLQLTTNLSYNIDLLHHAKSLRPAEGYIVDVGLWQDPKEAYFFLNKLQGFVHIAKPFSKPSYEWKRVKQAYNINKKKLYAHLERREDIAKLAPYCDGFIIPVERLVEVWPR